MKKPGLGFMTALAYAVTLPSIFSAPKRLRNESRRVFVDHEKIAKAEANRQRKAAKRVKK